MIANIFLLLVLGHLVGDFVLQPLWLAIAKRQGWRGLLIHVTVVTLSTTIIVAGRMPQWAAWMVALFAIHLFIDQFRTFVFTNNCCGRGLLLLIADQLVHMLSLALIAGWATGEPLSALGTLFATPMTAAGRTILIVAGVIIAFWVAPILEIELVVAIASLKKATGKGIAPIELSDRMMGGAERVLALAAIAGGWWLLAPMIFVPRWLWLRRKSAARYVLFSKMGMSIGVAGLLAAILPILR